MGVIRSVTRAVGAESFDIYVRERQRQLRRSAWLLTGNWASAEDLTQLTLLELWRRWDRIEQLEYRDAYIQRALVNAYLSSTRRRSYRETPTAELPEEACYDARPDQVDSRIVLATALVGLPPRQRLAIVLRYFHDLDEKRAAEAMGCSVGTVKSQVFRGLRMLRRNDDLKHLLDEGIPE